MKKSSSPKGPPITQELTDQLLALTRQIRPKGFGPHVKEDLLQQAFLHGLELIRSGYIRDGADPGPILLKHIKIKLIDLRRREYRRRALWHTSFDSHPELEIRSNPQGDNEAQETVEAKLPLVLRADYLRMLDGVKVSRWKRERIQEAVRDILTRGGFMESASGKTVPGC